MPAEFRWIVVAGPTASGKSRLGLEIAERFGGEIVNADSRQIYRIMDIGTAKPSAAARSDVPHHLFDLICPDESFDVARYRSLARAPVLEVAGRSRLAVGVGGSGLYLRTLSHGLFFGPPADHRLRTVLNVLEGKSPGTLHRWCRRLDPLAAGRLHPNDIVRLVRALEVALRTGQEISVHHEHHGFSERLGEILYFVLDPGREKLAERIADRSRQMFENGLIEEGRGLWNMGYGPELRVLQSIGYREAASVLRGERTREEAIADLVRSTIRFAKRQLTWFRREPGALWMHPDRDRKRMLTIADEFLRGRMSQSGL